MERMLVSIGIGDPGELPKLAGAASDAEKIADVLGKNAAGLATGSISNFQVALLVDRTKKIGADEVIASLEKLLADKHHRRLDCALVYFSGHAQVSRGRTYLITSGFEGAIPGRGCVDFATLLDLINRSKVPDIVLILDCCHAGATFDAELSGLMSGDNSLSLLRDGVVVMAGAARDGEALEVNGHGLFTRLVLEGLEGGAADVFGDITASSLYAYVDERLGGWDQRPILKANITRLLPLRRVEPSVTRAHVETMRRCFPSRTDHYQLSPDHDPDSDSPDRKLVDVFQRLKDLRDVGLVTQAPGVRDFYTAAMTSSYLELTHKGQHVLQRMNDGLL